ncbi:MAG: OsmC family protein [Crocinitomicaceae bacterium]
MKVVLDRKEEPFHFEAIDENGFKVQMDANPAIGGLEKGMRPMELLLAAAGGCASIDLGLILKKQRQVLEDYQVEVSGTRKTDTSKSFEKIHLHFVLHGNLDSSKVERAITLTVTEYCSVLLSLNKEIEITHSFEIKNYES